MQGGLKSSFWKDFGGRCDAARSGKQCLERFGGSCDAMESEKQFLRRFWRGALTQWALRNTFLKDLDGAVTQ